jgi:hypothetical protein
LNRTTFAASLLGEGKPVKTIEDLARHVNALNLSARARGFTAYAEATSSKQKLVVVRRARP